MTRRKGSKKYRCDGCGKNKAGGGQRFCYGCLCLILYGEKTPLSFVPTAALLHSGAISYPGPSSYPSDHPNPCARTNGQGKGE